MVPNHWSLLLGQIAVVSFAVCCVSGVFLMFFYDPSTDPVTYEGSYAPLHGVEMSRALESTMDLSFEVRGGLLMRQLHHWSASVMIAALMLHILRVFFTGAFRKPHELNWLLLFAILLTSMMAGMTGHILPDDMLSGTSLAVMDGLLKGIPLVGTWLSTLVFQGRFPSGAIDTFYLPHIVVLPGLILIMILLSGMLSIRHKPAQFPGPGRTQTNVVGRPMRVALVKSVGLSFIVCGVLTLMAAMARVNPVWLYGPADPASAAAGGGAIWYLAPLDGAQRLVPPGWEFVLFGYTWTLAIFVPIGVYALFLVTAMVYPFIERWITGDKREHHLLARPRNAPTRTGIGVAGVVFYGVLWAAGGSDVIALSFSLSFNAIVLVFQVGIVLGPIIAFVITKRICIGLQYRDIDQVLHGYETGIVERSPSGGYSERHAPLPVTEQYTLTARDDVPEPTELNGVNENVAKGRRKALRVWARKFYYDGTVARPTTEQVERAAEHLSDFDGHPIEHGEDFHGVSESGVPKVH